ncbi:HNH endonuclease [Geobacillus subterraneus]|uniref:HNH endonuclease n=2 Tax=Geobacillus TaxID=129337 RepID=UPI0035D1057C
MCGDPRIEAHHVRFRSQGGRGKWRNLAPLCHCCHQAVHQNRALAERLMAVREDMFGKWYWADEYDLYENGLIKEPLKENFEDFMRREGNEEVVRHCAGKEIGGW